MKKKDWKLYFGHVNKNPLISTFRSDFRTLKQCIKIWEHFQWQSIPHGSDAPRPPLTASTGKVLNRIESNFLKNIDVHASYFL